MKQKLTMLLLAMQITLGSVFAQPIINNVSPLRARIDSNVTIMGSNFIANTDSNIVYFGPVRAEVASAETNKLIVKTPLGAGYQPLSVTTRNLTATANLPSNVRFAGQTALSSASFEPKIDSSSLQSYIVNSEDLDGDGKPDVIAANNTANSITIYRNTTNLGNISFAPKQVIATIDRVNNFKVIDLDGDGRKDIVTGNFNSTSFSVYRNTSTIGFISFAVRVNFSMPVGTQPAYLNGGDLDGDGKPDIIVTNYPLAGFAIFRNTSSVGNISFATRVDNSLLGTFPAGVEIADLNNDGKKEVILSNSQQYNVAVFQNVSTLGNISLSTPVTYATTLGVHELAIADLNNDGKLDIVTGDYANVGGTIYATTITVLQNNATFGAAFNPNSFNAGVPYTAGLGALGVKLGDLDGDGKTDVVVGNHQSNYISLFRNLTADAGTIALGSKFDITTGNNAALIELADLTNDGKLDIISSNFGANTLSFLKNNIVLLSTPQLLNFVALPKNNTIQLNWELNNPNSIENMVLECSANAKEWIAIEVQLNPKNANTYLHKTPILGKNYYRLKQTNRDSKIIYSDIRVVDLAKTTASIAVYPNPIKNGYFTIDLGITPDKNLTYSILTIEGKLIKQGRLSQRQTSIQIPNNSSGLLYLKIENESNISLVIINE